MTTYLSRLATAAIMLITAVGIATPAAAQVRHEPSVDLTLGPAHPKVLVSSHIGGFAEVHIHNRSATAVRPRLTIDLPTNWSARLEYRTHGESCASHPHHYICTLERQDNQVDRSVQILLFHHHHGRYGSTTHIGVHVSPVGAHDPKPANNDATLRAVFKGTADVVTQIARTPAKIGKGKLAHFSITMTNHGPSPATGLSFFLRVITGTHNGFRQHEPSGPATCEEGADGPVDALMPYVCDARTLGKGQTFTYHLTWRGLVHGASGHLQVTAIHDGYQPGGHLEPGALRIQDVVTNSKRVTVRG